MKNDYGSKESIEGLHRLEDIIEKCCKDTKGYEFVPDSYSYYRNINGKNVIGIDKSLLSETEDLIKYDKKYLSAIKMTVYHEIGHSLFDGFYNKDDYKIKEEIAELYAINKGSIDDYIIEVAVISNLTKDKLNSEFNQTLKEPRSQVEYLLKHDGADKWENRRLSFYIPEPLEEMVKDAFNKIKLPYKEIFERILIEKENVDSLKRKNNLFIDRYMISRK